MTKHAYTIKEAVEATGISRSSLYIEIKRGRLQTRKLGARTIILGGDLQTWLEGLPASLRARSQRLPHSK